MASVARQGSNWTVRYRNKGDANPRRYTLPAGSGKRAAEAKAREIQTIIDRDGHWAPAQAPPATLDAAVEAYIDARTAGTAAKPAARPATLRMYDAVLRKILLPAARGRSQTAPLRELNPVRVRSLLNERHRMGRSPRTLVIYRSIIGSFWKWARAEYGPEHVPPVELPDVATPPPSEVIAPGWEEIDRMIAALPARCEVLRRTLLLQRYTGLRISQAARLRRRDLLPDFEGLGPALHVHKDLGKSRQEAAMNRRVPVHPELLALLQAWREADGRSSPDAPLVGGPLPATSRDTLRNAWRRAGVIEEKWFGHPSHVLRKRFVTALEVGRVRERVIDYLIGHARADVKGRSYIVGHELWPEMVEAVALIPPLQLQVPA
jgi:integrase